MKRLIKINREVVDIMKTDYGKKVSLFLKRMLNNGVWLFVTLMGIKCFFLKDPYSIVVGMMLILVALLFFSFFDNLLRYFNINLTGMQKWFIGVSNFLTAAYSVTPSETNYFRCVLSLVIMLIFWAITIVYSKKKLKKSAK